jgi:hypothetical protein
VAIGDVETQNLVLDAWLGPNRAAIAPDSYDVEPWCGDPRDDDSAIASVDGVDLDPVEWDSDDWLDADDGEKMTNAEVEWVIADGLDDAVTHAAIRNRTSGLLAYSSKLDAKVFPLAAGTLGITPVVSTDDDE